MSRSLSLKAQQKILPAFPKTKHLPWNPNADSTDFVASEEEASVIFNLPVNIEEKIDGASVGMHLTEDDNPVIRNRDHILSKGYYKDTPAKEQFRPLWNWFYDNKFRFEALRDKLGMNVSVYGEWCLAQHGLEYDKLPDWFIAYDIYDYEEEKFLSPVIARQAFEDVGFQTTPRIFLARLSTLKECGHDTYENLAKFMNYPGEWTKDDALPEGLYFKTFDGEYVTNRFKMVRPDFVRGALWNKTGKINKNSLVTTEE